MTRPLPPLLFALPLLLWSWQGGHWLIGLPLAIGLEWAVRTPRRWAIRDASILRLADLTALLLLGLVLFHSSQGPLAVGLFALLHWSPLLLLPLLLAQMLGGRAGIPRRALFYSQRRSRDAAADRPVDLLPIYVVACLLAAGQDSLNPQLYLLGLFLVIAWLFWWQRPRRGLAPWVLLMSLALASSLMIQVGLREVQGQLEDFMVDLLTGLFNADTDPFRSSTALGDYGRLNLSDRILYRVESERPLLLRTASYDRYYEGTWLTDSRQFTALRPSAGQAGWSWPTAQPAVSQQAWIAGYRKAKWSMLPLPLGTWRVQDLAVTGLERNGLGAVRALEGAELVRYHVDYGQGSSSDAAPTEADLRVPRNEREVLAEVIAALQLNGLTEEEQIARIAGFFREGFRYSLDLPGEIAGATALEHFLRQRRQGHCEYFASATVLLLRQAGIPARYAVGYSVQERTGRASFRVRHSHGHAWTLYWQDGRWWNLDTTPAIWAEQEAGRRSLLMPLWDGLSELYYRFNLWRETGDADAQNPWLWGALVLMSLVLAYRLRLGQTYLEKRKKRSASAGDRGPWTPIEQQLTRAGYPRQDWETYGHWLGRLRQHEEIRPQIEGLNEALRLHYRQRYGSGLDTEEQARLLSQLRQWLRRWKKGSKIA